MKLTETKAWKEYKQNKFDRPDWDNSAHSMIKRIPPAAIGSLGKALILDIFESLGHNIEHPENTDHDIKIDGKKVELKTATNAGDDKYIINQIRPNQDFEVIIMLLIDPNGYRMFKADSKDFKRKDQQIGLKHQHADSPDVLMLNVDKTPPAATEILKVDYNAYKL